VSEGTIYVKTDGAIAGATKYDAGKSTLLKGGISYFPKAIALVSSISHFGATKYAWDGWRHVDDGFNRYSEAMVRHLVEEGSADILDPDSRLPHIGHTTWNALARLELWINDQNREATHKEEFFARKPSDYTTRS